MCYEYYNPVDKKIIRSAFIYELVCNKTEPIKLAGMDACPAEVLPRIVGIGFHEENIINIIRNRSKYYDFEHGFFYNVFKDGGGFDNWKLNILERVRGNAEKINHKLQVFSKPEWEYPKVKDRRTQFFYGAMEENIDNAKFLVATSYTYSYSYSY